MDEENRERLWVFIYARERGVDNTYIHLAWGLHAE